MGPFVTRLEDGDIVDDTWTELTSDLGDSVQTGAALAAGKRAIQIENRFDQDILIAYDTAAKDANVTHTLSTGFSRDLSEIVGGDGGAPTFWVYKPAAVTTGTLVVSWVNP